MSRQTDRLRVLIADDDDFVCEALQAVIGRDEELELVGVAKDAQEAIDEAQRLRPHVVVLDVKMPRGGGMLAAERIREISPNCKLVAFSVYSDPVTVMRMIEAGSIAYVLKGVPTEELLDAIKRAARGQGSLPEEILTGTFANPSALAEWLLVQSRRRRLDGSVLAAALELFRHPAVAVDFTGTLRAANGPAAELFGEDRQALTGQLLAQATGDPGFAAALVETVMTNAGVARVIETTAVLRPSGTAASPVRVIAVPVVLPDGPAAVALFDAPSRRGSQEDERERLHEDEVRPGALSEVLDATKKMQAHAVAAQEEERARIAAELHDEIVQAIVAMAMTVDLLRAQCPIDDMAVSLNTLADNLRDVVKRVREIILDLADPRVMQLPFARAMEQTLQRVCADADVSLEVEVEELPGGGPEKKTSLLRIAQEAVGNAVRHAQCRSISVSGKVEGGRYVLVVADDGRGFEPPEVEDLLVTGHYGIATMRRRAARIGGSLEVESAPGSGTVVRVSMPLV